jgi:hypothetical protein
MDGMEELPVQMHNLMHIVHKVGGCKFVLEEIFFSSCAILFWICCSRGYSGDSGELLCVSCM